MNNYKGDIIEESLKNKEILKEISIISTRVEKVTEKHQTPWLSQWTLNAIEVSEDDAASIAEKLSKSIDSEHGWYIDFFNDKYHYVIFNGKIFKIDRNKKSDYDEMIKYGKSVGTPDYQLPNFFNLPVDVLEAFLKEANLNTYANKNVKKTSSLRPGSYDYHFEKDSLVYHDTFFGSNKFIGEEIVYKKDKPVWGMNYYGFTLSNEINENLYDAILRPALMSGSGDNIPVRGPKEFITGEWKYIFKTEGTIENFTGLEEISKNDNVVCRLYCHGGFIENKNN